MITKPTRGQKAKKKKPISAAGSNVEQNASDYSSIDVKEALAVPVSVRSNNKKKRKPRVSKRDAILNRTLEQFRKGTFTELYLDQTSLQNQNQNLTCEVESGRLESRSKG